MSNIKSLKELKEFEDKCLLPEVWCYDFDGVVHTKMAEGQNLQTNHRDPDKKWLHDNFTETNFKSLLPYLFTETINHMKYGQSIGAKIVIVSANSWRYKTPIYNILKHVGVNITEDDIHMSVSPKNKKLENLNCTLFMDDSCANIKKIYDSKIEITTLKKLVFVVPEKENNSPTHYEIDLNNTLNICGKKNWHENLLDVEGIQLLDYPKNTFKLTSWNVYFELMYKKFPNRLKEIKEYLSEPYRKPDILFTQESYFDLPKLNFNDYTHIYWSSPGKSAISTHFNNKIFKLNSNIIKVGIDNKTTIIQNAKEDEILHDEEGDSHRPILAIKLKHNETNKNIIFVNLWAPHNVNDSFNTNKFKIYITVLEEIIKRLHTSSERIIMAGDFNEFYEQSKIGGYNVDTLNLNGVELFLKQRDNTCCGSTNVERTGGLFDGIKAKRPFDLLYDSNPVGSVVRVEKSRISDHLPISANITI